MANTQIKLKILGMHCTSCAFNIDGELEETGKIKSVSTSYAKQITEITFDPKEISHNEIIRIIKKLGYDAIVMA
jgi:Cu+-exporting ATPase